MFQGLMAPVGLLLAAAAVIAALMVGAAAAFDIYHFLARVCA